MVVTQSNNGQKKQRGTFFVDDGISVRENLKRDTPSSPSDLTTLLAKASQKILVVHSVWPFDFFPNTLMIDHNKIDFIYNDFFWTKHTFSVHIKNVNCVIVGIDPLFASLTVKVTGFEENPEQVKFLKKSDAILARRLIMGLVAADKEQVDLSAMSIEESRKTLEQIGKAGEEAEGGIFTLT